MERKLLIHSMAEFSSITLPILEAVNANTICEIGAEHGGNSKMLHEWLVKRNGKLISIDPKPSEEFLNWYPKANIKHIAKLSHEGIADVKSADAWFIDGDHNWYTVFNELIKIREFSKNEKKPMLIFLHDTGWPCARRDFYYAPDQIPEKFRQPHHWEKGVTLNSPHLIDGGFRSNGIYAIALHEGGPRNGVLTAVEDFLQLYPKEYCLANIPAVFGMSILFDLSHPQADLIATIVSPYHENSLLKTLELNRLDNYLKVLDYQDANMTSKPSTDFVFPSATTFGPTPDLEQIYGKFEKMALDMINILSDEQDHPDLWNVISLLKSQEDKAELKLFIDYLSMLLAVPQEEKTIKIISILEIMCLTQYGEVNVAKEKILDLFQKHTNCPLVKGTFSRLAVVEEVK